jgi:hypothetical protein
MQDALVSVSKERNSGTVYPPWETAPNGVVSLLAMLEFSASKYVKISHHFGLIMATLKRQELNANDLGAAINGLLSDATALGLEVTREHLSNLIVEIVEADPSKATVENGLLRLRDASLDSGRSYHHIECVYSTLEAELSSIVFKAVPREKARFCNSDWLLKSPIFEKFPETVDEFQKAGRCFAYGENTACIFHLMRVTDFYLRKVAESIPGTTYDARSWDGLGKLIVKRMEEKYQTKTDEWKSKEPFYAEILTDIQAISRGHRNPALHELEKKYDEREATYMLTVIEGFARHVAEKL